MATRQRKEMVPEKGVVVERTPTNVALNRRKKDHPSLGENERRPTIR